MLQDISYIIRLEALFILYFIFVYGSRNQRIWLWTQIKKRQCTTRIVNAIIMDDHNIDISSWFLSLLDDIADISQEDVVVFNIILAVYLETDSIDLKSKTLEAISLHYNRCKKNGSPIASDLLISLYGNLQELGIDDKKKIFRIALLELPDANTDTWDKYVSLLKNGTASEVLMLCITLDSLVSQKKVRNNTVQKSNLIVNLAECLDKEYNEADYCTEEVQYCVNGILCF